MLNQYTHYGCPRFHFPLYAKGPEVKAGKSNSSNIPSSGMDVSMQCLVYYLFPASLYSDCFTRGLWLRNPEQMAFPKHSWSCLLHLFRLRCFIMSPLWCNQKCSMSWWLGLSDRLNSEVLFAKHMQHLLNPPKCVLKLRTVCNGYTEHSKLFMIVMVIVNLWLWRCCKRVWGLAIDSWEMTPSFINY